MTPTDLLDRLFAPAEPARDEDIRAFLARCNPSAPSDPTGFERLVHLALQANNRLNAGVAGHQAAIRRLFPDTPHEAVTAFCVSEDQGPRPSAIRSSLTPTGDGFLLKGAKKWGSLSPLADLLYVAASIGEKDGRNQLRMVKLPVPSPGLTLNPAPYAAYQGHMPIADLTLSDIALPAEAVLPADAYEAYIKPFRLIEDVYGTAATQIAVFRLGRRKDWPQEVLEDLVALILQAQAIAQTPMARPQDVVLMSAYFRASDTLWNRLGEAWDQLDPEERAPWNPKAGTLSVAAKARQTRRQNAWAALGS
jgi:alkylation response protein AidB-like acyl-CoA dehydrogenase